MRAVLGGIVAQRVRVHDPEPQLIDALAAEIRAHDYELAPVMSTLLQSTVFYSNRAYRALVKNPVEFVVGTHTTFGLPQIAPRSLRSLTQMGQTLFYRPNVAGWPGGSNWLTTQTLIARQNFLESLVNDPAMENSWLLQTPLDAQAAASVMIARILQQDAPQEAYAQPAAYLNGSATSALNDFSVENFSERMRGAAYLASSMPAYQLS